MCLWKGGVPVSSGSDALPHASVFSVARISGHCRGGKAGPSAHVLWEGEGV